MVFLQSPGGFKVEEITCYKSEIKLIITSFQDIKKELLEGLLYKQCSSDSKSTAINSLDEKIMKQKSYT